MNLKDLQILEIALELYRRDQSEEVAHLDHFKVLLEMVRRDIARTRLAPRGQEPEEESLPMVAVSNS